MATKSDTDLIVGILLIVLGILVATGPLGLGVLVWIGAVAAIITGILMLLDQFKGSTTMAVVLLVSGILVLSLGWVHAIVSAIINIVVGVVLVTTGVMKIQHRW